MILIIGPAYSGKREYAQIILRKRPGGDGAAGETQGRLRTEVQELVTAKMDETDLRRLADSLARSAEILTASETGAGIVPVGEDIRRIRESQGKLLSLLAARADTVVRVFYGIPEVLKGELL